MQIEDQLVKKKNIIQRTIKYEQEMSLSDFIWLWLAYLKQMSVEQVELKGGSFPTKKRKG